MTTATGEPAAHCPTCRCIGHEQQDMQRLRAALQSIATAPEPRNQWEAFALYRAVRAAAANALPVLN